MNWEPPDLLGSLSPILPLVLCRSPLCLRFCHDRTSVGWWQQWPARIAGWGHQHPPPQAAFAGAIDSPMSASATCHRGEGGWTSNGLTLSERQAVHSPLSLFRTPGPSWLGCPVGWACEYSLCFNFLCFNETDRPTFLGHHLPHRFLGTCCHFISTPVHHSLIRGAGAFSKLHELAICM